MQRPARLPTFPGLLALMLFLGGTGTGAPGYARFWLLLVALLLAGLLWWGLEAWQERRQVRRHVRLLEGLRAFADRLHVGSLAATGFYRDGSLELSGRWRGVPVRLQARQHPPSLRLEVWTNGPDPFDAERTWGRLRGLARVPAEARGSVTALLQGQGFDWISAGPTGFTASRRLDVGSVDPDRIEAAFALLLGLASRCPQAPAPLVRAWRARGPGVRCPYCHAGLEDGSPTRACGCCGTGYHADCYRAGGCAILGCAGRWRALPLGAARA